MAFPAEGTGLVSGGKSRFAFVPGMVLLSHLYLCPQVLLSEKGPGSSYTACSPEHTLPLWGSFFISSMRVKMPAYTCPSTRESVVHMNSKCPVNCAKHPDARGHQLSQVRHGSCLSSSFYKSVACSDERITAAFQCTGGNSGEVW